MENDEIFHYGIQDMRWGLRRYQNADGSLTSLGRQHYGVGPPRGEGKSSNVKVKKKKKESLITKAKNAINDINDAAEEMKNKKAQRIIDEAKRKAAVAKEKQKQAEAEAKANEAKREAKEKANPNLKNKREIEEAKTKKDVSEIEKTGKTVAEKEREEYSQKVREIEEKMNRDYSSTTIGGRGINTLSNNELQSLINRINLERDYARLTYKPTTKDKIVNLAKKAGAKAFEQVSNSVVEYVGNKAKNYVNQQLYKKDNEAKSQKEKEYDAWFNANFSGDNAKKISSFAKDLENMKKIKEAYMKGQIK